MLATPKELSPYRGVGGLASYMGHVVEALTVSTGVVGVKGWMVMPSSKDT